MVMRQWWTLLPSDVQTALIQHPGLLSQWHHIQGSLQILTEYWHNLWKKSTALAFSTDPFSVQQVLPANWSLQAHALFWTYDAWYSQHLYNGSHASFSFEWPWSPSGTVKRHNQALSTQQCLHLGLGCSQGSKTVEGSWWDYQGSHSIHSLIVWTHTSQSSWEDQLWVQSLGVSAIYLWSWACFSLTHPSTALLGALLQIGCQNSSTSASYYYSLGTPRWWQNPQEFCQGFQGTLLPMEGIMHSFHLSQHTFTHSHCSWDSLSWFTCLLCTVDNGDCYW